jgi:hypothetical protein
MTTKKSASKLAASIELLIVYPAKTFLQEQETNVKNTTDKKIQKIVGRVADASGCDVASPRAGIRELQWEMVRRKRVKTIESAIAKLGTPGVKVIVSEREAY